jgi:predicted  nucleic acid-binding Zn-ribbon protein
VETAFRNTNERFDRMETSIKKINERMDEMEIRMERMENVIRQDFTEIYSQIDRINQGN